MDSMSVEQFNECLNEILALSNAMLDGWSMDTKEGTENGTYMRRKQTLQLSSIENSEEKIVVTFEYHIAYNLSYGVPMLCLNIWRQDGRLLSLEDYYKYNEKLKETNMYDTITQMDHPVLKRPFLTLHPCRTIEIIRSFVGKSKNPVISWLSVIGPYVHLELPEEYYTIC